MANYSYDHLVYIRLFEGCNLFCEHCFIPKNPKKINQEYFKSSFWKDLKNYSNIKENQTIYLQWHGGEPTILGAEYLKKCIEDVSLNSSVKIMHGIQTNLLNFQDEKEKWIELYHQYFNSEVGVSWDWGIRHHQLKSIEKINISSSIELLQEQELWNKIFWKNIADLKYHDIEPYLVVTFTKHFVKHFKNPFDFFELMHEHQIKALNFERITKNGMARIYWDKLGLNNLEYSQAMSKFYKSYQLWKKNHPEKILNISPFDGLKESVQKLNQGDEKSKGFGCWSGSCDTTFHTIDAHGYKKGCTALTSEDDNNNKDLLSFQQKNKVFWMKTENLTEKRLSRQEECLNCEFLAICSSGCLSVEKFDISGECSGAKTLFNTIKNGEKYHEVV